MRKLLPLLLLIGYVLPVFSNGYEENEIQLKEIFRPYKTVSPYITKLLSLKGPKLQKEVELFWKSAALKGLPLIEEDPLDKTYTYLTMIYRDSTKNINVKFDVVGIYEDNRLGSRKLRHLKNSDLYYRSYKVPKNICFAYRFIVTDTIKNKVFKKSDIFNNNKIPTSSVKKYSYSVVDLNRDDTFLVELNNPISIPVNSKIDTLFYTDKIVHKKRKIYVYLPDGYDEKRSHAYPVIYLFDAFLYLKRIEVPNILDNLITQGKIEPTIAVFFSTYKKSREKILALNARFKDEFVKEFIPEIRKNYNVSNAPEKNTIAGISYGGLAATYIAFSHPEYFGRVLGQSSSFWRGKQLLDHAGNWIRHDWLINAVETAEKKEIRLFLDWGLQENWVLGSNRRMVRVLNKKNYTFKYHEFNGWHDWANSRKTFSIGLSYLMQ